MALEIADELKMLEDIKYAQNMTLRDLGVDMTGVTFEQYKDKFDTVSQVKEDYVYPSDWLPLPDMPIGIQKCYALLGITTGSYKWGFRATVSSGQYRVDWGDGIITLHNTNTIAEHNYIDFSQPQRIVTIEPVVADKLTSLNFQIAPTSDNRAGKVSPLLAFKGNVGNLSLATSASLTFYGSATAVNYFNHKLEYVEILGTLNNATNMFTSCTGLQKIILDKVNGPIGGLCYQSSRIRSLSISTLANTTTVTNIFNNTSFKKAPFTITQMTGLWTGAFANNPLLEDLNGTILKLTTETAAQITVIFAVCTKLKKIELDLSTTTSNSIVYTALTSLEELRLYNTTTILNNVEVINANLTLDGVLNLFNDLPNRTTLTAGTIKITGNLCIPNIPQSTLDIATNKNWTIITT